MAFFFYRGSQNRTRCLAVTRRTPKVTRPGRATFIIGAGTRKYQPRYRDLDAFWSDLVAAYHQEMRSLGEAGCSYLQIDETALAKLGDPRARALLKERFLEYDNPHARGHWSVALGPAGEVRRIGTGSLQGAAA
jgi:5-methyltetrahydropteroyltriglutamate--homocysteine methyltransferase